MAVQGHIISEADAADYAQAVGVMYGGAVVLKLHPDELGGAGRWHLTATFMRVREGIAQEVTSPQTLSYPSRQYKSFGGCMLAVTMNLEQHLQAQWALNGWETFDQV